MRRVRGGLFVAITWLRFRAMISVIVVFSMVLSAVAFVSVVGESPQAEINNVSPPLFNQVIDDELIIGENSFAIHGELDNKQLFKNDRPVDLDGIVPWWVSGLEMDDTLHLVVGDAAYRHYLSHYIVSSDDGETWKIAESFHGFLKPHITAVDGTVYIMFERNLDLEKDCLFKLINGQFEMIKGDQSYSYADVLDYRTTEEYAEYDAARKSEVFGHPPERSTRAPQRPWSYLYICNGEASGIESLLEDDANEMAAGGSSANHWSVCFFDDNGAGPNEMRVMDDGGGGGYTVFTTAELGLPAEPDLNDPNQIITILDWWFVNYPGQKMVWDSGGHGGGTSGAIYGENPTSGVIDLVEITTIANAVRSSFTKPIDIISWDLCQMMTHEWLYGYKPITNYTVCSMDNIAGAGYNYQNLMNYVAGDPTPEEMAHEIALDYWTGVGATVSTVDMNNWDYTFWPTFNNIAQECTHGSYLSQINTAHSSAWVAQKCHDVWEWMDNMNTGISDPTIQALSLQARDEVWTSNYPTGLDDVVQVEYSSSTSHHGIGDEAATNAAWMIDIETMRDEMLSVQGVSNAIPTCTITDPSEGGEVPMDGIYTIHGTASDSDGSVSYVEVKINREWWQLATGTNSWSFSWDVADAHNYYGLGPCKVWARSYDGTDYSNWECINVNIIESFGSEGNIYLDRSVYPVEDTMTVTVTDGDLLVPSIDVTVVSDSEPGGELVTLLSTPLEGKYEAPLTISATNSIGVLMVADGDTITATYNDADDGTGSPAVVIDTAFVDGQVASPSGLTVAWWGETALTILDEDFSVNPTDWTITHTSGTAWIWSSTNQRMEHTYGSPNAGYLDSPEIDCSAGTDTTLSFWHYWRADYSGASQDGYVRGSIDGGSTWPYLIDEFHHNDPGLEDTIKNYPIYWADGESQVMIRFDIYNDNDWYWRIDDVLIAATGASTTVDNKLDWALSSDDGGGQNDVVQYNIYRANNELGPWSTPLTNVPSGTVTYVDPGVGEFDGINWWYVVRALDAVGNEDTNTNAIPEVPTSNIAPSAPNNPTPSNGAIGVSVNPTLSVWVSDPNGDSMDVSFYDASGPSLVGTNLGVPSGTFTNLPWNGLSADTTYDWYAVADDGEFTTQSSTWSFTTMDTTPPGSATGLTVEWWGQVSQTWIDEDFSGGVPPTGWNIYNTGTVGTWSQQATSNAGGTAPECRYYYGSNGIGTSIIYAGPFDTSGITSMDLQWQNQINDYTGGTGVACKIQTSSDASTWTDAGWTWDDTVTPGSTPAELITRTINTADVGSSTFYIGWTCDGNSYQLNYWYIDDVLLTSTGGGTTEDNWLNWTLSSDDGAGANDVDHYNIYRSDLPVGPWDVAHLVDIVPAGADTYMDFGRGEPDGINWWYVVRAEDIWGNEELNTNAVPEIPVADMPPIVAVDVPNGGEIYPANPMITVDWTASDDNPWGPTPNCWIYYDDDTNPGNGQTLITNTIGAGTGTHIWDATGVPAGDYYIHIIVEDSIAQTGQDWSDGFFTILPPVYNIDLTGLVAGDWVLASYPIDATGDALTVFDDAAWGDGQTDWDLAQWYDNVNKLWRSYSIYKPPSINDMDVFDNTMGVWLHLTANGGDHMLTVGPGDMPAGPMVINLYAGWNLVSYPSATPRFASATLPPEGDLISVYDAAEPYLIRDELPSAIIMQAGNAYWVHCTADAVWTVNL